MFSMEELGSLLAIYSNVLFSNPLGYQFCPVFMLEKNIHFKITPGLLGKVALWGCFDTILYSWPKPVSWMRINLTHEWSQDTSLFAWHRIGCIHIFFSGRLFYQMSQTVWKGISKKITIPNNSIPKITFFSNTALCVNLSQGSWLPHFSQRGTVEYR